jgi:predicted ferric reductase
MITMPNDGSTVTIWSGWATCRCQVSITQAIVLYPDTLQPSHSPTTAITSLPTSEPSKHPTVSPTTVPSSHPTAAPSAVPTLAPSVSSQPSMTAEPTAPSAQPTKHPTSYPTAEPTSSPPSAAPSHAPTNPPSYAPTHSPTLAPTVASKQYSLTFILQLLGVSASDAQTFSHEVSDLLAEALGVVADRISLSQFHTIMTKDATAASYLTNMYYSLFDSLSISPLASGSGAQCTITVAAFNNPGAASNADTSLNSFLADSSSSGFEKLAYARTGLNITSANALASRIVEDTPPETYSHSCNLNKHLKLYWEVVQSNASSMYLQGMLEASSDIWISGGVAIDGTKLMVDDPNNVVYMCLGHNMQADTYVITSYDASGIVRDNRYRDGSRVMSHSSEDGVTHAIKFRRDANTGISGDAKLVFVKGRGNLFIWAHGGSWPDAHTTSDRGLAEVFWMDGKCWRMAEEEPVYILIVIIGIVVLVALAALYQHFLSKHVNFFKVLSTRQVEDYAPALSIVAKDVSTMSLAGSVFVLALIGLFLAYVISCGMFYEDNLGYDTRKAYGLTLGGAAMCAIGIAILPVNKTSLWSVILGVSYDRITKYHRMAGRSAIVFTVIHCILEVQTWGGDSVLTFDTSSEVGVALPAYGLLAGICFVAMALFALDTVRKMCYELFQFMHLLFIPGVAFAWLHLPHGTLILIVPLIIYAIDLCLRIYQYMHSVEVVKVGVYEDLTILTLRAPKMAAPSPGGYVLVQCPQVSIGQWHPFSVYDYTPDTHQFKVAVKSVPSGWTECLLVSLRDKSIADISVNVLGPYGHLPLTLKDGRVYTHVVLVSGGIGITPILSIAQSLLHMHPSSAKSRMPNTKVTIIAVSKTASFFATFSSQIGQLKAVGFDVQLFATQSVTMKAPTSVASSRPIITSKKVVPVVAPAPVNTGDEGGLAVKMTNQYLPSGVTAGRPHIPTLLGEVTKGQTENVRVAVVSCGPEALSASVRQSCGALRSDSCSVDLHVEAFNL